MRHTVDLHDNNDLCALDMSRATREQQAAWLTLIVDNELDRGDEGDSALIWECTEQLRELYSNAILTREEAEKQLRSMLTPPNRRLYGHPKSPSAAHRISKKMLRIGSVAAVILMVAALFPHIYVHAVETQNRRIYEEAVDFRSSGTDPNTLAPDISAQKPYEATYTTLKDFFADHSHLSFYYPQQLPQERGIEQIHIKYQSQNSWVVVFTFLDPTVKYFTAQALPYTAKAPVPQEGDSVFTTSARQYVTTPGEENGRTVYETVGLHDNIRYTISTYDYGSTRYFLSQATVTTRRYDTMEELLTEWDHLQEISWHGALPDGFSVRRCSIQYLTQTNWSIKLLLDCEAPSPPGQDHTMTIRYIPDSSDTDTPPGDLLLKNDKTEVGIHFPKWENSTYHEAECIVGNTGYQIVIYDRDLLLRFVEDYFGPFELP